MLSRRRLLGASALALSSSLLSSKAGAIGPRSEVGVGAIRTAGNWDLRPEALRRLLWEAGKRTSIQTARDRTVVSLEDDGTDGDALFWQPLLFLAGEGPVTFSSTARARLERHLRYGGLLVVDAQRPDDAFADSVRKELAVVLPGLAPRPLAQDHVVYKSFFLLERAWGRADLDNRVHGIDIGDRTVVLFSHNDLLGAFERDRFGTWRYECTPDGETQRENALRFGVNILMYATCLDYKSDQVHIPFIMKKKRR